MGTRKKLSIIGNSFGLIIDRPILDILNINENTELDISTDGNKLIIVPAANQSKLAKVRVSHNKIMNKHDKTFKKLAK